MPSKVDEYKARSTLDTECIPWNMAPTEAPLPSVQIQDVSSEPESMSRCNFPNQSNQNYPCNSTDNESGSQTKATRVTDQREFALVAVPNVIKQKIYNFSNTKSIESASLDANACILDSKRHDSQEEDTEALLRRYDSLKKQYLDV